MGNIMDELKEEEVRKSKIGKAPDRCLFCKAPIDDEFEVVGQLCIKCEKLMDDAQDLEAEYESMNGGDGV